MRFIIILTLLLAAVITSSCTKESAPIQPANFHHVHLNVTDSERTRRFYEKFFGATEIDYRGKTKALFTERSFILLDQVAAPPRPSDGTALWHIGWAGVDGASEFKWRVDEGIDVHTPLTRPVLPGLDNKVDVMYFSGLDKELIEISTAGRHHRFDHVHLLSSDVNATTAWFRDHLRLAPNQPDAIDFGIVMNNIVVDNVNIVIFGRHNPDRENQFAAKELWPQDGFRPTEGSAIDHMAFSFASIDPVLGRMRSAGVQIVKEPSIDAEYGHRSFSVRGPDSLLIEIVEDRPIPEGVWAR